MTSAFNSDHSYFSPLWFARVASECTDLSLLDSWQNELSGVRAATWLRAPGGGYASFVPTCSSGFIWSIDFYQASGFGISLSQLVHLISERGTEGKQLLKSKYAGVEVGFDHDFDPAHPRQGIARRLKVSLETGVKNEEDASKVGVFGCFSRPSLNSSAAISSAPTAFPPLRPRASGR